MPLYTADALVLRTYKLGEADRIVVFLTRDRGKKRRNLLAFELFADDLLVPGSRPDGIPLRLGVHRQSDAGAAPDADCCLIPSSYAFWISGFFHSMIA